MCQPRPTHMVGSGIVTTPTCETDKDEYRATNMTETDKEGHKEVMSSTFLGLPLFVWGIACLGVASIWVSVWPRDRGTSTGGLRFMILRWFHALTWLLLGVAAFTAGFPGLGGTRLAQPIALLALALYLIFMTTFVTSKQGP